MDIEKLGFFYKMPQAVPLYEAFVGKLRSECGDFTVRVQKTQISFFNRYLFACVSLRKIKGCGDAFIVVSFGLDHRENDARIQTATQPYPNRWTHHVIVQDESEIDNQLMNWIRQAYEFALNK